MKTISGSCLCGGVKFECANTFEEFHLCHCLQCQKTTGAAHVANLFTDRANITWISGVESIKRYDIPGRTITSAFCMNCGSPVPYISSTGKHLVVPAGCLDEDANLTPQDHIFWSERASWYDAGVKAPKFPGFNE